MGRLIDMDALVNSKERARGMVMDDRQVYINLTDWVIAITKLPTTSEAEIRAKAIDEFAEKLKAEIIGEINDISVMQRSYEVHSDMSVTCSHIMGTLRDVHSRMIDKIADQMKESE